MIAAILHFIILHAHAQELPDTQPEDVTAFVVVAIAEETPRVPAELLVSLAWAESRFQQLSRPGCGVLQVFPKYLGRGWSCQDLQADLVLAVRAGVVGIEMMLDDQRVRGDLHRALMYRACGNTFFVGKCSRQKAMWVERALARTKQLSSRESS